MLNRLKIIGMFSIATMVGILVTLGCNPDSIGESSAKDVDGQVLLDGKPVAGAKVVFIPFRIAGPTGEFQEMALGTTDAEGKFTLSRTNGEPGVVSGMHRVMISKKDPNPARPVLLESVDLAPLSEQETYLRQPADEMIPVIYNLHSTLTFNVDPELDPVQANFDLSSVDPLLAR